MVQLRPQDVAIALQLALRPGLAYRALAEAVGLSQSEVHGAVKRLAYARLVRADIRAARVPALLEFLTSGVPYAFPAEPGAESRGVPTAFAGPSLAGDFPDASPLVWPAIDGDRRGATIEPLYAAAPATAKGNPALYDLLTLVDALRVGRARERQRARILLEERLMATELV